MALALKTEFALNIFKLGGLPAPRPPPRMPTLPEPCAFLLRNFALFAVKRMLSKISASR